MLLQQLHKTQQRCLGLQLFANQLAPQALDCMFLSLAVASSQGFPKGLQDWFEQHANCG